MWAGAMAVTTATCGGPAGQRGDLLPVAHAHLEHSELGVPRHAREAERTPVWLL